MQQNIKIPLLVGLAAIAVGALIVQGMNITPAAFAMHHHHHHHHHHHGHHHSSTSVHQRINQANICSNSACSNTASNTANIH